MNEAFNCDESKAAILASMCDKQAIGDALHAIAVGAKLSVGQRPIETKRRGGLSIVLEGAAFGSYPAQMSVIQRLSRSRAGSALLMLASAAAIFLAGTRFGEFLAIVTSAAG